MNRELDAAHRRPDERPASLESGVTDARLPVPLTSFVGRDDDIAHLRAFLDRSGPRLVSLVGPGGIGKTRLAIAIAATRAPNSAFVSLAEVVDPSLIPATILRSLGLKRFSRQSPLDVLAESLGDQSILLVLDNCEQMLAGAPLIAALLSRCPALTVLATSRAPLGITGEHIVPVDPLDIPTKDHRVTAASISGVGAVRLFTERAAAVNPGFRLSNANAADIAAICRHLEGVPLAIELAAARSWHFSPKALAERLGHQITLVGQDSAAAMDGVRSIRAAVAWSANLLDPQTHAAWQWLAVFEGGFTIESAEALAGHIVEQPGGIQHTLDSLARHGLLRHLTNALGEPRFAMLETTRLYALERLAKGGQEFDARTAHAVWARRFVQEVETELATNAAATWLERVNADIANIRAAMRWHLDRGAATDAAAMATALAGFWSQAGYVAEGRQWCDELLDRLDEDTSTSHRALVLTVAADLANWHKDLHVARDFARKALVLWHRLGDDKRMLGALRCLGSTSFDLFEFDEADAYFTQAYELALVAGTEWDIAAAANLRGLTAAHRNDFRTAVRWSESALNRWRASGFDAQVRTAHSCLGREWLRGGDTHKARTHFTTALTLGSNLDLDVIVALNGFAMIAASAHLHSVAARLFGAAHHLRQSLGLPLRPPLQADVDEAVTSLRHAYGEAVFARAWSDGLALSCDDAIDLARSMPQLADQAPVLLTRREREVLDLIVEGQPDAAIADQLSISPRTVSNHVSAILNKLGASNRTAAVAIATRRELI